MVNSNSNIQYRAIFSAQFQYCLAEVLRSLSTGKPNIVRALRTHAFRHVLEVCILCAMSQSFTMSSVHPSIENGPSSQPAEEDLYGKGYAGDYDEIDSDGEYVIENYYGPLDLFDGLNFHLIGQFDHSEQCRYIIREYGGEIKAAPSKLVDYVVLGEKPGLNRLERIRSLGLTVITEREFFQLTIRMSPNFRNLATPERIAGRDFERRASTPLRFE